MGCVVFVSGVCGADELTILVYILIFSVRKPRSRLGAKVVFVGVCTKLKRNLDALLAKSVTLRSEVSGSLDSFSSRPTSRRSAVQL